MEREPSTPLTPLRRAWGGGVQGLPCLPGFVQPAHHAASGQHKGSYGESLRGAKFEQVVALKEAHFAYAIWKPRIEAEAAPQLTARRQIKSVYDHEKSFALR